MWFKWENACQEQGSEFHTQHCKIYI
jgi:hypothetical protein